MGHRARTNILLQRRQRERIYEGEQSDKEKRIETKNKVRQGRRDQIGQRHDQRQLRGLGAAVLQENSQERECGPLGALGTKVKTHSMAKRQRRTGRLNPVQCPFQ